MTFDYSWEDFDADARRIAKAIAADARQRHFKSVYGIPRGGVLLALYLSHTLGLECLCAPPFDPQTTLIVDDNTITGDTLATYDAIGYATAALIHAPTSTVLPTYMGRCRLGWPIFPWEQDSCVTAELSCAVG